MNGVKIHKIKKHSTTKAYGYTSGTGRIRDTGSRNKKSSRAGRPREIGGRRVPDPEIANAWDRLIDGSFNQNDIGLLNHGYFESRFESFYQTTIE